MCNKLKLIGLLSVGLLAALGTSAEAHYMYAGGRWVKHSVGCVADIVGVSNPATSPAAAECAVNVAMVETLCQDSGGQLYPVTFPLQVDLSAQAPIAPANVSGSLAELEVVVPDAPLLNVNVNPACVGATPIAVLVRNMASTVTIFRCVGLGLDPCAVRLMTSTATATCELPAQFNFADYPQNVPPAGTPYSCTEPTVVHAF